MCRSVPGKQTDSVQRSEQAVASGWGLLSSGGGSPNTLMKVSLDTMSNRKCRNKWPHITANMICAGRGGKSTCYGDSGGPLVTKENNGSFSLIGVVSHGGKCGKVSISTKKYIVFKMLTFPRTATPVCTPE